MCSYHIIKGHRSKASQCTLPPLFCAPMHCMRWLEREVTLHSVFFYKKVTFRLRLSFLKIFPKWGWNFLNTFLIFSQKSGWDFLIFPESQGWDFIIILSDTGLDFFILFRTTLYLNMYNCTHVTLRVRVSTWDSTINYEAKTKLCSFLFILFIIHILCMQKASIFKSDPSTCN